MASKRKSSQRRDVPEQEVVFQAVVIADSFNVRFAPITKKTPRTLLPLANTPLLDYTLQFLCEAGIQKVYVYCCAHAEQIKAHIRNSKWSSKTSPCSVHTIVSEDCMSVGDALRDIDCKSLIQSDFVLVNGDLISNLKLKGLIDKHKERRKVDKSSVMTLVFKQAPPCSQTRCQEEEVILAINTENQKLLHYEKVADQKKMNFPLEIFTENEGLQLRYDLLDCQISICSPDVPPLFSDNFDYQTRDDFVKGIQTDEEIHGNTIYTEVIEDEYAARVSNLQMYDAVSKDVLTRWSYPLVPDSNISSNVADSYSYGRHNVYLSKDVTLARGCVLKEEVIIGSGTSIGGNTIISHSVIGKNCVIGENVKLNNAYIWDNVTICDNCDIKQSILCNRAKVKGGVTVEARCILSYDVTVGPDVRIPSHTFLMSSPQEVVNDSDDEEKIPEVSKVLNPGLVGAEGRGYVYTPMVDSEDEGEELVQEMWGLTIHSDDDEAESSGMSDTDSEESDIGSGDEGVGSMNKGEEEDDTQVFYEEVLDTLLRAQEENLDASNIILEINALKHAYNITIKEVNEFVIKAIIDFPQRDTKNMEPAALYAALKPVLNQWMNVLQNYIKSNDSQMDCLHSLEDLSLKKPNVKAILMKLLHFFYESDILPEEVVLQWHANIPASAEDKEGRKGIRTSVDQFVNWLKEAEEEESDDDDDDDDD
ncbi:translation initiation factor eIF2B subunit epsilon-like [Lineus longissimus]|uniref:translation initiation factor eIF2B subunit epsilon-like n=1 Tax=Lineus longissimus TaxID=88925 RepID=UPI002B4F37EC